MRAVNIKIELILGTFAPTIKNYGTPMGYKGLKDSLQGSTVSDSRDTEIVNVNYHHHAFDHGEPMLKYFDRDTKDDMYYKGSRSLESLVLPAGTKIVKSGREIYSYHSKYGFVRGRAS
jgi:hypothetical protein